MCNHIIVNTNSTLPNLYHGKKIMQIIDYLLLNQDNNSLSWNKNVKQKVLIHLTIQVAFLHKIYCLVYACEYIS